MQIGKEEAQELKLYFIFSTHSEQRLLTMLRRILFQSLILEGIMSLCPSITIL